MFDAISPPGKKGDDLNTWLVDLAGNVAMSDSGLSLLDRITSLQVPAFNSTEQAVAWGSYLNTEQHETLIDIQRTADNAAHGERDPQRMVNLATQSQLLREAADAFIAAFEDRPIRAALDSVTGGRAPTAIPLQRSIAAFGEFILAKRDDITRHWVSAVDHSSEVQASQDLTYRQLLDHLPQLCTELAHVLQNPTAEMLRDGTSHYSSVHGAKRWQQGYCLEELIREVCLLRKDFVGRWFDAFEMEQTALSREARRCARGIVHRFFDDVIIGSTLQFVEEQQQRARDAEAALIAAKERAEVANEAKSRFIALISHELRTPLTPMLLGAAALELDKSLSPEVMDFVHLVNHSTLIEAALIGDLLDATRLTHEELTLQLAEVDVHACIQSAVDACAFDFQVKHIELKVSLCAESSWAAGDGKRMARAFTAILRNAAHVSRLGGCVTIQTRNVDRSIEISVQDCGVEFDERIAERIFLPFEEGRQSACGMGGMGVSRYVCKATIEAHGGTITAQSAGPNGGAVFLVTLPVLERSECV